MLLTLPKAPHLNKGPTNPGKGYLSHELASVHGLRVVGVDARPVNTEGAAKYRAKQLQRGGKSKRSTQGETQNLDPKPETRNLEP